MIVEGPADAVAAKINELTDELEGQNVKCAVIASQENIDRYHAGCVMNIGQRSNEESIAANLYAVLREMDDLGVRKIYSESFSGQGLGAAIMNRLIKAAGHQIIRVQD